MTAARFFMTVLCLLAGCSSNVTPEDVALAQEQCSGRGGYEKVARYEHGRHIVIDCVDGTNIEVRRSPQ